LALFYFPIVYNPSMTTNLQKILTDFASRFDKRVTVCDVEISDLSDGTISLKGRVLEESQLRDLRRLFPTHQTDTSSLIVLNRPNLPRRHTATNLTGLYEKPSFGVPLASELTYGTELEILQEQGHWAFVRQRDGYLGWVYQPYLTEGKAVPPTHLILAPVIELRVEPKVESQAVTRLVSGTSVVATGRAGKWSRVEANKKGWIPSVHLRALSDLPRSVKDRRATLVEDAYRMIGTPYLWGGMSGNGIDCSGFSQLLHRWIGLDIPRDADMQYEVAKPVEAHFKIGDLLFFGEDKSARKVTHVGVSLGGWKVIHSSRTRNGVEVDDVQTAEFLREIYLCAGSFIR